MNSQIRLKDMETGEEKSYTLVFPSDADIEKNRISILAPIGTAILGYRAGDTWSGSCRPGNARCGSKKFFISPRQPNAMICNGRPESCKTLIEHQR